MVYVKSIFASESDLKISEECMKCGLYKKCASPQMPVTGDGELGILIIAEAPGAEEDRTGKQLVGEAGQLLRKELSRIGLDLDRDFWKTNTLICRPPGNKTPTDKQIRLCKKNLERTIEELQPRFIWTLGNIPTKAMLGKYLRKCSITSLCNRKIPLKDYDAWVLPMYHPSFLLRNKHDDNLRHFFRRNLKMAMDLYREDPDLPKVEPFENVELVLDYDRARSVLQKVLDDKITVAFDFETTGLYPWEEVVKDGKETGDLLHTIVCIGIAYDGKSYAIPLDHKETPFSDHELDLIIDDIAYILEDEEITIIGHNVNFDLRWSEWLYDVKLVDSKPIYCTQTMQHILDHRTGNKSLKDLAFINWGIQEYDKSAKKYIKAKKPKSRNRMREMPLEEELLYVGADAYLTMLLYQEQRNSLSEEQERAVEFFMSGLKVLRDIQNNGMPIDRDHFSTVYDELTSEIDTIHRKIMKSKEAQKFSSLYRVPFDYNKPRHLKDMLFKIGKQKSVKLTTKGSESTDEEALTKMDFWMCKDIIQIRKLTKLRDTYIAQYNRNNVAGIIYPEFQLATVSSFRSSCKDPNIQNTPKRNAKAKEAIRRGFIPPKGWKMFELDFDGMEVSTSAMYHKDKNFINYLLSDDADMHRDNGGDIWIVDPSLITKMIRFYAKNQWTFPQFYGDYFGSCAPQLWNTCVVEENLELANGVALREHMRKQGIRNLDDFIEHCKHAEDIMWNKRFPEYTQWKKDINDFYNKYGYVETYLGFRFTGYMDRKQVANYPIQGTAFHLLLWSLHRANEEIKANKKVRAYLAGEVHDSMIGYVHPDSEEWLFQMLKKVCTEDLPNEFDFINVPMGIEIEVSEVDGTFAELTEVQV